MPLPCLPYLVDHISMILGPCCSLFDTISCMEHKPKALERLRQYTADGKTYFVATAQLANEGFSQSDINDATFAFRAGKDKVQAN